MLGRNRGLLRGAGAAPCVCDVTRGELDQCNDQAVSGRAGHALWQIAPSSSLLAHPLLPLQPHPAREHSGPPQSRPSGSGDSVPNLRSNLETSFEKDGNHSSSLVGQRGPMGLPTGLFLGPWSQAAPPPGPPGLGHVRHWAGGVGGCDVSHVCLPGLAPRALLPPHPPSSPSVPTSSPWRPSCPQNQHL